MSNRFTVNTIGVLWDEEQLPLREAKECICTYIGCQLYDGDCQRCPGCNCPDRAEVFDRDVDKIIQNLEDL